MAPRLASELRSWSRLWGRHRFWIGWLLAALSVASLAAAIAVPFFELSFAWAAGSVATLVILAEVLAALAFVALGKDLYRWLRESIESLQRGRERD